LQGFFFCLLVLVNRSLDTPQAAVHYSAVGTQIALNVMAATMRKIGWDRKVSIGKIKALRRCPVPEGTSKVSLNNGTKECQ
jgi:hypothetical protein